MLALLDKSAFYIDDPALFSTKAVLHTAAANVD